MHSQCRTILIPFHSIPRSLTWCHNVSSSSMSTSLCIRRIRLNMLILCIWTILALIVRWNPVVLANSFDQHRIEAERQEKDDIHTRTHNALYRHILEDVIVGAQPPPTTVRSVVVSTVSNRPSSPNSNRKDNVRPAAPASQQQRTPTTSNGGPRGRNENNVAAPRNPSGKIQPKRIQPTPQRKQRTSNYGNGRATMRTEKAAQHHTKPVGPDEPQSSSSSSSSITTPATKQGANPPRTEDLRSDAAAAVSQIIGAPASNIGAAGRPTLKQVEANARAEKDQSAAASASRRKNSHLGRDHGPIMRAEATNDADVLVSSPPSGAAGALKKVLPHKFRGSAATAKLASGGAAVGDQRPSLQRQPGTVREGREDGIVSPNSNTDSLPPVPETENIVVDHKVRFVAPAEAKLKQQQAAQEAAELAALASSQQSSKTKKVPISALLQVGPVPKDKANETPVVATPEQLSQGGAAAVGDGEQDQPQQQDKPKSHSDILASLREQIDDNSNGKIARTSSVAPRIVSTDHGDSNAPFFVAGVVTPDVVVPLQTVSHVTVPVVEQRVDPQTGQMKERTVATTEKRVQTHEIDTSVPVSVPVPKPSIVASSETETESRSDEPEFDSGKKNERDTEEEASQAVSASNSPSVPAPTPAPISQLPPAEELSPLPVAPVVATPTQPAAPSTSSQSTERPTRADSSRTPPPQTQNESASNGSEHEPVAKSESDNEPAATSSTETKNELHSAVTSPSTSSDDSVTISDETEAETPATPSGKLTEDHTASTVEEVIKAPIVKDHTTVQPIATTKEEQAPVDSTPVETSESSNTSTTETPATTNDTQPTPVDSETSASTLVETSTWKSLGPAPRSSSSSGLVIVIVLLSFLIFVGLKLKRCLAASEDGEGGGDDDLESGTLLHGTSSSASPTSKRTVIRPGSGQVVVDALTDEEDPEERYNKNKAQRAALQQDSTVPSRGMSLKMAPTKPARATSGKKSKLSLGARQLDSDDD